MKQVFFLLILIVSTANANVVQKAIENYQDFHHIDQNDNSYTYSLHRWEPTADYIEFLNDAHNSSEPALEDEDTDTVLSPFSKESEVASGPIPGGEPEERYWSSPDGIEARISGKLVTSSEIVKELPDLEGLTSSETECDYCLKLQEFSTLDHIKHWLGDLGKVVDKEIKPIENKEVCETDEWSKSMELQWSKTNQIKVVHRGRKLLIKEEDAYKYLLRAQYIDSPSEYSIGPILIKGLLRSEFAETHPGMVKRAMQMCVLKKTCNVDKLKSEPNYKKVLNAQSVKCESKSQKEKTNKRVIAELNQKLSEGYVMEGAWHDILSLFQDFISIWPPEHKKIALEHISQKMAEEIHNESRTVLFKAPMNKLWFYSEKSLAPYFGEKMKKGSELLRVRSEKGIELIAISSSFIDDKFLSDTGYGIYARRLGVIEKFEETESPFEKNENKNKKKSVEWETNNKKYKAKLSVKSGKPIKLEASKSPNYKAQYKDGERRGLIFIGQNRDMDSWIVPEYLAFYQDAGFDFTEEPEFSENFNKILEKEVSSGKLDYLRQDSHTGSKDFGDVPTSVAIYKGKRKNSDGTFDEVQLVMPRPDASSVGVNAGEFASWLTKRPKGNQLLYMDGRCNSDHHSVELYSHAGGSDKITILPTATGVHPMKYYKNDANRILLHGLMNKQSYSEIRENMSQSNNYASGNSDVFIFPDENSYMDNVGEKLKQPMASSVKMEVKDLK